MATATTTTDNIIVNRDYTDNFSIKETAMTTLGEKYFGDLDLSALNVGALGFTLEQIANITEDAFNSISVLFNESFPIKACIPESIYSHAAVFQIDSTFASCSKCSFIMMLSQDEVLEYGESVNGKKQFFIDKRTIISVEGKPFTLDYDIKIEAVKRQINGATSGYNFSAKYVIDMENSISDVNDPYLKIRKTPNGYLILQFSAHQVERIEDSDTIISNTKVNYPVLDFDFEGKLAGFDIFYKAPSDKEYTQLTKRIMFSTPIKQPFCYYRLKNENTLSITFTTRDGYFQPEFNSDIKIVMYTTLGSEGEFDVYNGTNIEFLMNGETYEYNNSITIAVKTVSESRGGNDGLQLEELQALTVEAYSTATELSTESDIMQYFHNFQYRYGNEILVIKRRDDITERLFSAFLIIRNEDYIYPTNTLHVKLHQDNYDSVYDANNRFTLKPGHCFVYDNGSMNTVTMVPDVMCYETEKVKELIDNNGFVYTNPFMISVTKSPNLVGLYKTITNQTAILDYVSSNNDSFTQFITSKINVKRGLSDKSEYVMSLSLAPSSSLDSYIDNLGTYEGNDVRVIASFVNSNGEEMGYIELLPTEVDPADNTTVVFSATIETNDDVTTNGLFPILNGVKTNPKSDYIYAPISDCVVNIYVMYYDGLTRTNKFTNYFDGMELYTLTNTYSTKDDPITFIAPMNMMRSTVTFANGGTDNDPVLSSTLTLLPFIKADIISDIENFNVFIEKLTSNYEYLEACLPQLSNNTHLDIKFYNTYGKSSNYTIGTGGELIDRVNLSIKFDISIIEGTDDMELRNNLKIFIKNFIENINENGSNDLYISNLIRNIETNFASVHHLKFRGINEYNTDYQTICSKETDLNNLSKIERRNYVPEILVADLDNILLSIDTI